MAAARDVAALTALLGREPGPTSTWSCARDDGEPLVVRNAPFTRDGHADAHALLARRPRAATVAVSRLEAAGGVRAAQAEVDPDELAAAHARYAARARRGRPRGPRGPRPHGGVGGTRTGVKCLHAHYAYFLAGGDDPVGRWVAARLASAAA